LCWSRGSQSGNQVRVFTNNAEDCKLPPKGRKGARSTRQSKVAPDKILAFMDRLIGDDFHAKRVLSLADGVVGVLHAASLSIHAIGRGLSAARNLDSKHATKQVDRLLSNSGISMHLLMLNWIRFIVGVRKEIVVALDWTEFDADDQSVIALYLVTKHGRATPLVWKSVRKSKLKGNRTSYEWETVEILHEALAEDVTITVLADRGFGDIKFYEYLDSLGWNYVIRFRQGIEVACKEESKSAGEWLHASGRARKLSKTLVTMAKYEVPSVVVVKASTMKDSWCLASNLASDSASKIVSLYGRRFTIEETFRDTKDIHFGMGLSATHIRDPKRRELLLFLGAVAHALLTLLGEAGEACGLDRGFRRNTQKKRPLSLYRQGCYWYDALAAMDDERARLLMSHFDQIMRKQAIWTDIFAAI